MIRVAVVDDHPAMRAALANVLTTEPDIVLAGESDGEEEHLWPMLNIVRPDLVLLDYHLPPGDGLQFCHRIKHGIPAPKVIVFTAYASPALALPAILADADAMLPKGTGAGALFAAIRQVSDGKRLLPPISAAVIDESCAELLEPHRALVTMLLAGATETEVGRTLELSPRDVRDIVRRILSALQLEIPGGTAARPRGRSRRG
jgi:two-component system, NarL family, response regulator DevR